MNLVINHALQEHANATGLARTLSGLMTTLEGGIPNQLRRNHMKHTDNAPTSNPNRAGLRRQNQAAAAQLRAQLMAERLNMYVAEVVAGAPPLTPAQRDRLALLLQGGASPE